MRLSADNLETQSGSKRNPPTPLHVCMASSQTRSYEFLAQSNAPNQAVEELRRTQTDRSARLDFGSLPKVIHAGKLVPMHAGQQSAFESERRIIAVFKGWQGGGTAIGAPWLRREMQKCGAGDYAVISPTKPLMLNKVIPELLRTFQGLVRRSGDELIVTPEGAAALWGDSTLEGRILLRTAWKAEMLESFTALALWADEAGQMEDSIWEAMQARVAVHQGRMLLTSRPYWRNWFVKQTWDRVVDIRGLPKSEEDLETYEIRRKPSADDDVEIVCFASLENPSFPKAEFDRQLTRMPWWRFAMRYLGIPTKAAGMVYDCLSDLNLHPRFPIPAHWPRVQGVDFGTVNLASVFFAREPDPDVPDNEAVWYLFSRYHEGKMSVSDHVTNFRKRQGCRGVRDRRPVQPLSMGGSASEDNWREHFGEKGWVILEPPFASVDAGIQIVYEMLREGRLVIFDDCEDVINQLWDYSYETDDEGEPDPTKIKDKEQQHICDAIRYGCVAIDRVGPLVVRQEARDARKRQEDDRLREILGVHDGDDDEPPLVEPGAPRGGGGLVARSKRLQTRNIQTRFRDL